MGAQTMPKECKKKSKQESRRYLFLVLFRVSQSKVAIMSQYKILKGLENVQTK